MSIYITIMGWGDAKPQVDLSTRAVPVDRIANLACEEYVPADPGEEPTLKILEVLLDFPGEDRASIETQLVGILTRAAELYHETMQKQEEVTTE